MVIYYSKVPHLTSPPMIIISGSAMVFRLYGLVCAVMLVIFTVCRVVISIASILLIFPGKDLTDSKEEGDAAVRDGASRRSYSQPHSIYGGDN